MAASPSTLDQAEGMAATASTLDRAEGMVTITLNQAEGAAAIASTLDRGKGVAAAASTSDGAEAKQAEGGDHGSTAQNSQVTAWSIAIRDRITEQPGDVVPTDSEQLRILLALSDEKYPSIFRLRENAKGITVAAIGPYHRSAPCQNNALHQSQTEPELPIITDGKKSLIVKYFAEPHSLNIVDFLQWAWQEQDEVRRCYDKDSFSMESEDFAKMLLFDGCLVLFAVFLLRSSVSKDEKPVKMALDQNYGRDFTRVAEDICLYMRQLKFDLLRLDNQIPFFVIEKLYSMLKTTLFAGIPHGIKQMALSCFDDIQPRRGRRGESSEPPTPVHLLHLFHWSLIPSEKYRLNNESFHLKEPKAHLPSATELWESSATIFRRSPPGSSLDVSFRRTICMRGAISIPASYICDYSESIFRNLIAFEQKHIRCSLSVTAYCICMARLLQSEDDAKLLRKNRILAHTEKSDKEIVDFFRSLSDEYSDTLLPKDLLRLYKNVQTYHDSRLGRMWGGITLQYFPNPWVTVSLFCGAILFFMTIANNVHTVYRYYHPLVRH